MVRTSTMNEAGHDPCRCEPVDLQSECSHQYKCRLPGPAVLRAFTDQPYSWSHMSYDVRSVSTRNFYETHFFLVVHRIRSSSQLISVTSVTLTQQRTEPAIIA